MTTDLWGDGATTGRGASARGFEGEGDELAGGPARLAANPAPVLVQALGVGKAFSHQKKLNWALRDVDLTVLEGEFVSIIGRSGCGKSTLVRLIDGLISTSEGTVTFDGKEVKGVPEGIGFVFQEINLLAWRSVLQNVEMGLLPLGFDRATRRNRAMAALELVGLADSAERPPYHLSGGMQQRVGVARALALEPRLLLMDEPFGQLDSFTREGVQKEFARISESLGTTVLFVTHDIDEAIMLSSRIIVMGGSPGKIVDDVTVSLPPKRWSYNVRREPEAIALRERLSTAVSGSEILQNDR